jgi:hypothetical protein
MYQVWWLIDWQWSAEQDRRRSDGRKGLMGVLRRDPNYRSGKVKVRKVN